MTERDAPDDMNAALDAKMAVARAAAERAARAWPPSTHPLMIWMRSRLPAHVSLSAPTMNTGAFLLAGLLGRSPPIGTPLR